MILNDIFVYPIKSLAGIRVTEWDVVETGLRYDRQWMLVDENGNFLSQRRLPSMALIQTKVTENELIVSAENMTNLYLPLEQSEGVIFKSTVWEDCCDAIHVSKEADEWFSNILKINCHLVYLPAETKRNVDINYATKNDRTAFSDGFPFLLLSENSLVALNSELEKPVEMIRFRPNLVVSGCEAFAEDGWRVIQIGDIDFRLPKPCSRCGIPAINPQTAEIEKEPLVTLNRFRKNQNKIYFGQNALHNQLGKLRVGDNVIIKEIGTQLQFSNEH